MTAQFRQAPLVSLPVIDLGTGDAVARFLLQAPRNVHSDGVLRRSSAGKWVPSFSSVGRRPPFAFAEDAAGAKFLFTTGPDNLLEILTVENG